MLTVAFWNVYGKVEVLPHLACLAAKHAVDIFLLAECPESLRSAVRALNALRTGTYREAYNGRPKVRAITRLEVANFTHVFTGIAGDMAAWAVQSRKVKPAEEVLLVGVHLPSKMGGTIDSDQSGVAQEVISELVDVEDERQHRNTAVVGDFNMHPYNPGMTSVAGFHALMTRRLAELPDRRFRNQPRRRFYNPMWGLLGDRTPGPAGSYRWDSAVPHNPQWGLLDQVLLRKDLIDCL